MANPPRPSRLDGVSPRVPFGENGWRCTLPGLRLVLETLPAETALPALAVVTDASRPRALLDGAVRAGSPAHADIRIEARTPRVIRYQPDSRCTVVYPLECDPEAAGRGWPKGVVAKIHRGSKGRVAYEGTRALWESERRRAAWQRSGFYP